MKHEAPCAPITIEIDSDNRFDRCNLRNTQFSDRAWFIPVTKIPRIMKCKVHYNPHYITLELKKCDCPTLVQNVMTRF